jgi:hypothetical protein
MHPIFFSSVLAIWPDRAREDGPIAGQGGCGFRDEPIFFTEVNPIFIKQTRNRYKVAGDTCLQRRIYCRAHHQPN